MRIQIQIKKMPLGSHVEAGKIDLYGKWHPKREFIYEGAFHHIKGPRKRRLAYRDHFYSLKYAKGLAEHRPLLYMKIHKIDPQSEIGKILIARAVEIRLKGGDPCSSD